LILRTEPKADPTITASYKSLSNKLKHESPLLVELTADFQLTRDEHWVANGPVKDKQLEKLAEKNLRSPTTMLGVIDSRH